VPGQPLCLRIHARTSARPRGTTSGSWSPSWRHPAPCRAPLWSPAACARHARKVHGSMAAQRRRARDALRGLCLPRRLTSTQLGAPSGASTRLLSSKASPDSGFMFAAVLMVRLWCPVLCV
jgi:hypothetical protein